MGILVLAPCAAGRSSCNSAVEHPIDWRRIVVQQRRDLEHAEDHSAEAAATSMRAAFDPESGDEIALWRIPFRLVKEGAR
jgi:hypothetical protein